jgi:hypothetical protein
MISISFYSIALVGPNLFLLLALVIAILFFAPGLLGPIGRILGLTIGFTLRKKRLLSGNATKVTERAKKNSKGLDQPGKQRAISKDPQSCGRMGVPAWGIILLAVGVVTMLLWYLMHSN